MNTIKIKNAHLIIALAISLFYSCAKVVAPTGGPVDVTPPLLLNTNPANKSVNLKQKDIVFIFDEFFTVQSPSQNIFLSPMIDEQINHKIRGKRLIVSLPDSLAENKTYTLYFNNAVADFNEGNKIKKLTYIFSTGNTIDSLNISGAVINAETGKSIGDATIYLFSEDKDSALLKKFPINFAYSNSQGEFKIENISKGEYYLFAIHETSQNHIYDNLSELVGFTGFPYNVEKIIENDSLIKTTISIEEPLLLFSEPDTILKLRSSKRIRKGLLQFEFNNKIENINITAIEGEYTYDTTLISISETGKTANYWFKDQGASSIKFHISVDNKFTDTINVSLTPAGKGRASDNVYEAIKINAQNLINNQHLSHFDTLIININNPITEINKDSMLLIEGNAPVEFDVQKDVINPNNFRLLFNHKTNTEYKFILNDSAIIDFFNQSSDSTVLKFKTTDDDFFGTLGLKINFNIDTCHVIELVNKDNKPEYTFYYDTKKEIYNINKIAPGQYGLRVVFDNNCNQKWDTGSFSKRKPPEKTIKSKSDITIKSNWTVEVIWSD